MRGVLGLLFLMVCGLANCQTAAKAAPSFALPAPVAQIMRERGAARRREVQAIHTASGAAARQQQVRATMRRLIGPLPERTPLNAQMLGVTSLPGIRIERIVFESQPGFHVTALLYMPTATLVSQRFPAIVMAPGHGPQGKATDAPFAMAFARNGFAVLSYDVLGQGERLQYPDPKHPGTSLAGRPTGEHGEAGIQPMLLGESVAKYFLWDGMRAIDYLESRGEIDAARIGAFGCSGGGAETALLAALDSRVKAAGTACYLTSWETLLPSIGPQDGEQSTPGWLAAGLDFPDYVEAFAPRPYAIIGTTEDMFPYAGLVSTEQEARGFYKVLDGDKNLAVITGPGGHGNLKPLLPRILKFFTDALQPPLVAPIENDQHPAEQVPADALRVTPTGQVATSYEQEATVFSLNLQHAAALARPHGLDAEGLRQAIRSVSGTRALEIMGARAWQAPSGQPVFRPLTGAGARPSYAVRTLEVQRPGRPTLRAQMTVPDNVALPGLALVVLAAGESPRGLTPEGLELSHIVLTVVMDPAGPVETKSSLLGAWYLPSLALELAGRTVLGERLELVLAGARALNDVQLPHVPGITAYAAGHQALVLLHAGLFDLGRQPAMTHLVLHSLPQSYASLLADPLPLDASEDVLPGVLLHYDTPDLLRALGDRVGPGTERGETTSVLPRSSNGK